MKLFWRMAWGGIRDLSPVVLVILFFQAVVLDRPIADLQVLFEGAVLVVVGLTIFVYGLEIALFPVGDSLAYALASKGSFLWLLAFAFLLGFGTAVAEPALTAVATEAAKTAAAAGSIADSDLARSRYTLGLRLTVAFSVGVALVLGVTRIVLGWSLPKMIIGGYAIVIAFTFFAPSEAVGIAYDSGAVTTSVITVPLVTALGIGLASSLADRNPLTDGFGMIAAILLTPMIFVMLYGTLLAWI
ncbi:MAG TPA: DUF1538 domain-containing protein [Woeseiaceae bacterium]|nr:DUF1538 domain-containing protein [Woeseiaceae bacterium]